MNEELADPGRLFVGGHEVISTSPDGGRSWSRVNSLNTADAVGWSFTKEAVYVSGHPGISRSSDGGANFARANEGRSRPTPRSSTPASMTAGP